jgi:ABC-type transport system involved in multi-copper enzyme maturation permease subunit
MWTIVKKEIMDSVRNKWIILMTLVFIILSLVLSYFGSAAGGETGFQGFALSISLMAAIGGYLVSIMALMLGYASIVGEKETGSLDLLLSMPVSRAEVYVAKFLGLGTVLFIAIFAGFGSSGIVIAVFAGSGEWWLYVLFILATLLLGLTFLSVSMFLSSMMKKRSTSMGAAVLLWFLFAFIYNVIVFGIIVATTESFDPLTFVLPDWYYAAILPNPMSAYALLSQLLVLMAPGAPVEAIPWFLNAWAAGGSLLLWMLIPLIISMWRFTAKDILR